MHASSTPLPSNLAMGQQPPWTRETYPIQETEGTWEHTNSGMQSFSGMERREVVVGHTPQQVVGGTLLGEDMERGMYYIKYQTGCPDGSQLLNKELTVGFLPVSLSLTII